MQRVFLSAAIFLTLSGGAFAAPDKGQAEGMETVVAVETTSVSMEDNALTAVDEYDEIAMAPTAKKMTQAEKARNAAINDPWGGAITIIAMVIVISALVVLSLLFLGFGKISEAIIQKNKRQTAKATPAGMTEEEHHAVDSGEAIAAIVAALSEHFGEGHDIEDTILTIRRMKRAYSPWNSKIYNLRVMPELHRNPRP